MKKSIKKFASKTIKNAKAVKGGAYGRGERGTASSSDNRADLL